MCTPRDEPQIVHRAPFTVIGLLRHGRHEGDAIPAQWSALNARRGEIVALGEVAYGVEGIPDPLTGEWDYLAGLEADPSAPIPAGMTRWDIPAQTYAVIRCSRETLRQEYARLMGGWLPSSDYRRAAGPEFERYGAEFDPRDAASPIQVFIPIEPRVV